MIGVMANVEPATRRALLDDFVTRRRAQGLRVAGVVECAEPTAEKSCGCLSVLDLATSERIVISQDLGPGSTACNLDPSGLAAACAAAQRAIGAGADLVVLSKFGKLEAMRGGLYDAFLSAIEAELPVLTSVNPALRLEWALFSGDLVEEIAPEVQALEDWWSGVAARAKAA